MNPIDKDEIPVEIKECICEIKTIKFPRQGCTSDVGILETDKGRYVLKRSKGEKYSSWLNQEIYVLKALSKTNLPIPKIIHYTILENQTWMLTEFMEGQTLRDFLLHENDRNKR